MIEEIHYGTGELIYQEDHPDDDPCLYFIISGCVLFVIILLFIWMLCKTSFTIAREGTLIQRLKLPLNKIRRCLTTLVSIQDSLLRLVQNAFSTHHYTKSKGQFSLIQSKTTNMILRDSTCLTVSTQGLSFSQNQESLVSPANQQSTRVRSVM